ncbi:hypothetical protein AgCh_024032 [Apium graveolens]
MEAHLIRLCLSAQPHGEKEGLQILEGSSTWNYGIPRESILELLVSQRQFLPVEGVISLEKMLDEERDGVELDLSSPMGRSFKRNFRATGKYILKFVHNFFGFMKGTLQGSFGCKKIVNGRHNLLLSTKKFELNCLRDKEMDVKASSLDDYVKASASALTLALDSTIILFSFDNKATDFEYILQPNAVEYGPYDYTRGGNQTRDALESILAKLDKAERALCFKSGMAALATAIHIVGTGVFPSLCL